MRKLTAHLNKFIRLLGISKPGLAFSAKIIVLFGMVVATMHVLGCLWIHQVYRQPMKYEKIGTRYQILHRFRTSTCVVSFFPAAGSRKLLR